MRAKMKILAIDPGLRNLALCVMDNGMVEQIRRVDIFGGATIRSCDAFEAISSFCDRNQSLFDSVELVVIERQFFDSKIKLSTCLCIIQTVLQCRALKNHTLVHAATIKKCFGTHAHSHRTNKQAAVQKACEIDPLLFQETSGKLDDLADAYLLAVYANRYLHKFVRDDTSEEGEIR